MADRLAAVRAAMAARQIAEDHWAAQQGAAAQ